MKEVTATDAAGPTVGASGAAAKALLKHFRPDPDWSNDLGDVRALLTAQDREWPG